MKNILPFMLLVFVGFSSFGQDLKYKPKNPAFGGGTFNYQWLLSSANAQNDFQETSSGRDQSSDLENFSSNLNRQLLNQISRSLLTSQLGTEGLEEGTFSFGSLEVEVYDSLEGMVINILDVETGEQTQIIVP